MDIYDVAIIGAGPGGLASAIRCRSLGLSHLILEKGTSVFQGIIDSYPRGKKVYPTIPKGRGEPFAGSPGANAGEHQGSRDCAEPARALPEAPSRMR